MSCGRIATCILTATVLLTTGDPPPAPPSPAVPPLSKLLPPATPPAPPVAPDAVPSALPPLTPELPRADLPPPRPKDPAGRRTVVVQAFQATVPAGFAERVGLTAEGGGRAQSLTPREARLIEGLTPVSAPLGTRSAVIPDQEEGRLAFGHAEAVEVAVPATVNGAAAHVYKAAEIYVGTELRLTPRILDNGTAVRLQVACDHTALTGLGKEAAWAPVRRVGEPQPRPGRAVTVQAFAATVEVADGGTALVGALKETAEGTPTETIFLLTVRLADGEAPPPIPPPHPPMGQVPAAGVAPGLTVSVTGPATGQVGRPVPLRITLTNPGTAAAAAVTVRAGFDPALEHPSGMSAVELPVGTLNPGETREVAPLIVTPRQEGTAQIQVTANGDSGLSDTKTVALTVAKAVAAPALELQVLPPGGGVPAHRSTAFYFRVINRGPAPVRQAEVAATFPPSWKVLAFDGPTGVRAARGENNVVTFTTVEVPAGEELRLAVQAEASQPGTARLEVALRGPALAEPLVKEAGVEVLPGAVGVVPALPPTPLGSP